MVAEKERRRHGERESRRDGRYDHLESLEPGPRPIRIVEIMEHEEDDRHRTNDGTHPCILLEAKCSCLEVGGDEADPIRQSECTAHESDVDNQKAAPCDHRESAAEPGSVDLTRWSS